MINSFLSKILQKTTIVKPRNYESLQTNCKIALSVEREMSADDGQKWTNQVPRAMEVQRFK